MHGTTGRAWRALGLAALIGLLPAGAARGEPDAPPPSPSGAPSTPDRPPAPAWGVWRFLGVDVAPGERRALELPLDAAGGAADRALPIRVVRGVAAGPTLCLTAAVHGDEINGIEIVGQVVNRAPPESLRGTIVGVPIVNLPGFRRGSRYLPDRRDLNRFFPGNPRGASPRASPTTSSRT
jgi:predicted deacylase